MCKSEIDCLLKQYIQQICDGMAIGLQEYFPMLSCDLTFRKSIHVT